MIHQERELRVWQRVFKSTYVMLLVFAYVFVWKVAISLSVCVKASGNSLGKHPFEYPTLDNNKGLINLHFLQKINCQKTEWDQARFSSLV